MKPRVTSPQKLNFVLERTQEEEQVHFHRSVLLLYLSLEGEKKKNEAGEEKTTTAAGSRSDL